MDKKSIKLLTITNFCYFNNIYCKCSNKGKNTTENNQDNGNSQGTGQNPNDPEKEKEKPKKKNPEKNKTDKEKYIEKTKELREKFKEYEKIINGKDINNISETVSNHLCGFKNYGNTCYFNAAIQNLTHNKELVKTILDHVSKAADKGSIDEEIITFYNLIVKIYQQEEERKKDNKTRVIYNELDDLKYFIALNGILTELYDKNREKFSENTQQDSQELLSLFIDDLKEKINSTEDIFYFKTKLKKTCNNDECSENKIEEDKENFSMYKLGLEDNNNEEQIINIFNKEFNFEKLDEFKCEKCSENKDKEYKKNNSKELTELQEKFKNCPTCKNYFIAKKEFEDNKKITDDTIKNYTIKKDSNLLTFKEGENIKATLKEDKILDLIYNTKCKNCNKEYNDLLKKIYTYKKGKQVLLKKIGNYFIMYSNRTVTDFTTMREKKLDKNIVFETSLKLEQEKHGIEREENLDLVGIICQSGAADRGHYFSYNKINNKWYLFNDDEVSEVLNNKILDVPNIKSQNYVLFYKKQ